MNCDSVSSAISFNVSGGGAAPSVNNAACGNLANPDPPKILGSGTSSWSWNATLSNVPDGIIQLILNSPASSAGTNTGSRDILLLRKGTANNVMVWPDNDYDKGALTFDNGNYQFTHNAVGADMFRYSVDFGQSWPGWSAYEGTTTIDNQTFFEDKNRNWWDGQHVMVQCKCYLGLLFS